MVAMELEYREYKKITFPVRKCRWKRNGVTAYRYVGSEIMSEFIFRDGDGTYPDDEARKLDEEIAYYVPHDLIISGTDDEILDYIFYHIEEAVLDIFEETCEEAISRNRKETNND